MASLCITRYSSTVTHVPARPCDRVPNDARRGRPCSESLWLTTTRSENRSPAVLEQQAEWTVVGEAANGRDALKTFSEYRPNVT